MVGCFFPFGLGCLPVGAYHDGVKVLLVCQRKVYPDDVLLGTEHGEDVATLGSLSYLSLSSPHRDRCLIVFESTFL